MRSVAEATVVILPTYKRLDKLGYCADIQMRDIWPLAQPKTTAQIEAAQATDTVMPVVRLSRIYDDI